MSRHVKRQFIIEASKDGKNWKHQARFEEGDNSRFDEPFNEVVALKEAESFEKARYKDFPFVRLIIEL